MVAEKKKVWCFPGSIFLQTGYWILHKPDMVRIDLKDTKPARQTNYDGLPEEKNNQGG